MDLFYQIQENHQKIIELFDILKCDYLNNVNNCNMTIKGINEKQLKILEVLMNLIKITNDENLDDFSDNDLKKNE